MDTTDQLYQDFLSEMDMLERFRQRYRQTHPSAPLEREDPDVRRLMESMAFFSVQTRRATLHNLRATWMRLFSSFFNFLLEPLPATALVRAVPDKKMAEAVVLPRGTELRLTPTEGVAGSFRLQRDLRVLPLELESSRLVELKNGNLRVILSFVSVLKDNSRKDSVGLLSLHVRHLDEYRSSLAVYHALRQHLESVSVYYHDGDDSEDGNAYETARGAPWKPCKHSYRHPDEVEDSAAFSHPLHRVRSFFQLPEQGLFLHVNVAPHSREWKRFSLCLDLKKEWTVGRSARPDFLVPFVAPVVNLKAEPAQLLSVDGTRSEFPLLSQSAGREFRLQSVKAVYELTPSGRSPMRPTHLPGKEASYELEEELAEDLSPRHRLVVRMPEAFTEPRKVMVDALWYQPKFASQAIPPFKVSTPSRHVEGMGWEMVGALQPHRDSPVRDNVAALTQLLAWKTRPTLTREQLLPVLASLGTPAENPFQALLPLLGELKVSTLPDGAMRGSGLRHVYELELDAFEPSFEPLMVCLLEQVKEVLDAWNAEASVELRPTVRGSGPLKLWGTP
ncbi:type VI secretion system baseplate subunit TssF [Archangium lansingense]|uniref:type VI secretion system baseplate subunit TssF n=1 Tax=Archangium lansingense TaxID=2995310 RepID=UPI003B78FAD3